MTETVGQDKSPDDICERLKSCFLCLWLRIAPRTSVAMWIWIVLIASIAVAWYLFFSPNPDALPPMYAGDIGKALFSAASEHTNSMINLAMATLGATVALRLKLNGG